MADEHIGLDNPVFAGRLRRHEPSRAVATPRRAVHRPARNPQLDLTPKVVAPVVTVAPPPAVAPQPVAVAPQVVTEPKAAPSTAIPRQINTAQPAAPRHARSKVLMRTSLKHPTYQLHGKKRRFQSKPRLALTVLAIILFVSGLAVNFSVLSKSHEAQAQVAGLANHGDDADNDAPSETPPGNIKDYKVAPDMPRFIRIPKANVEARVKRMGVKSNNEMQAPTNVFDAGWYDGSSKPGEAGAALIDGHVSGPTKRGIFYELKSLVAGDRIQIERGDGKLINYKVVSSKSYAADIVDMASTLVSVEKGKPGLNLMTCDGQFDSKTGEYKNRLVVYAVQE